MSFTALFLFFFGAIGVFNSFLVSFYFLLFKKSKELSNTLFGFFLFFISERALRSLVYFFGDGVGNWYTRLDASSFLFIGPFLFLYVLSVIKPSSKIVLFWKYHILFWGIVTIWLYFEYPFLKDPIFWKKYILTSINIQWLGYVLLSGWFVAKHISMLPSMEEKKHPKNIWLSLILIGILVLWSIYFFISFSYFVVGSIVFSAIFYCFFLFFMFHKKESNLVFQYQKKYVAKRIDKSTVNQLAKKLDTLMREKKLYKNANLKSSDIAKELEVSTHQFSQLLNNNLGKNFSNFVNEYRIEEAKLLIRSNTKYTLDAIGNDSGFNSKSTFYTTFKRIVGMTPSKYKEQILSSSL